MRGRSALVFQIASLALTGWFLWGARLWSRGVPLSLTDVLLRSIAYALMACAAAAAITVVLYLTIRRERQPEDVARAVLRSARTAIWFAPAVILFTALSPAAVFAAGVLIVAATRLIYYEWRLAYPAGEPAPRREGMFGWVYERHANVWRDAAAALTVSFSLQTAGAAWMLRKPLMAGIGFALMLATATLLHLTLRPPGHRPPESLPRSAMGLLLTLVLAIGLSVSGMIPRMLFGAAGDGWGLGGGNSDTASERPPRKPQPAGDSADRPDLSKFPEPAFADSGFPGVILWPEVKPYATLIAPVPQRADGLGTVETRPLTIPFSGEYWMYRWPFAKPPRNSYFQRGSPADLSFRSTDHRPLQMEARHRLEQLVALDCCSRIGMAIRNADRFPDTIVLELTLIDNELPGQPSVSLGRELVTSRPGSSQTLSYEVPSIAPIPAFDEFKITFIRDRRRYDQSAKVAIDRFILEPRF